jgi:hypothetical protein
MLKSFSSLNKLKRIQVLSSCQTLHTTSVQKNEKSKNKLYDEWKELAKKKLKDTPPESLLVKTAEVNHIQNYHTKISSVFIIF